MKKKPENPENVRKRLLEVKSTRNTAVRVLRRCLLCDCQFMSKSPSNRRCEPCDGNLKETEVYRYAEFAGQ